MIARIAVLASGGGSNLQAIFDYLAHLGDRRAGDVVVVASDRTEAGALNRARAHGVTAIALQSAAHPDATSLSDLLREHRVDYVALAGYLRLIPPEVVRTYAGRMINVHPSLLPAFGGAGMYGHHVHRAVLDAGVAVTGVTVHLVDEAFDRGQVVAQWPVPVRAGDSVGTLSARVLRVEHVLYPRVIQALAAGRVHVGSLMTKRPPTLGSVQFGLADPDDRRLAEDIEHALDL